MKDEQFAELLKALKPEKKQARLAEVAIVDVLQKIAVSLTAVGVIWLVSSVSDLQRTVDVIKVNQDSNKEDISEFKQFTKKPRFSFDDFASQIAPMKQRLETHEFKLRERTQWMDSTGQRINKLEGKYELILEKLNSMNNDVSYIKKSLSEPLAN